MASVGPDRELIAELKRVARRVSYDEEALPDLDSEAVDFRAASESFAPHRRLARRDLEGLRKRGLRRFENALTAIGHGHRVARRRCRYATCRPKDEVKAWMRESASSRQ